MTGIINASEINLTGVMKCAGKLHGSNASFAAVSANSLILTGMMAANSLKINERIIATSLDLSGNIYAKDATFQGHIKSDKTLSIAGNVNLPGVVVSAENGDITGTGCLLLNGSVSAASFHAKGDVDAKGKLYANAGCFQGDVTAHDLVIDGDLLAKTGMLISQKMVTEELSVNNVIAEGVVEAFELRLGANLHMADGILEAKSANISGDVEMGGTLHAKDLSAKGDIKAPGGTLTTQTIEATRLVLAGSAAATCLRVSDYIAAGSMQVSGELSCAGVNAGTTGVAANVSVDENGNLRKSASSRRYKIPEGNYKTGLQKLKQITPVSYRHKDSPEGQVFAGMYAEDMDAIGLKEFVIYQGGKPDGIAYGNMAALLINSIKELDGRLMALEASK